MAKRTTTKSKTASKRPATAASRKASAGTAKASQDLAATAQTASVTSTSKAAQSAPNDPDVLRKPDLIEQVVARSGVKKKDAKPVVEAMLAVLGQAIADGQEMRLPPLGKVMVNRTKDLANGTAHIVKVRQPQKSAASEVSSEKDPLANAAE